VRRSRGDFDNSLVKVVTSVALSLFLALNFPLVFLATVVAALSYVAAVVGVACAYRYRYGIVGKLELGTRFAAKASADLRKKCQQSVADALYERERRKCLRQERSERLRRYKRELNRKKRERARKALSGG
jgi:sensor histidine kinase YesM